MATHLALTVRAPSHAEPAFGNLRRYGMECKEQKHPERRGLAVRIEARGTSLGHRTHSVLVRTPGGIVVREAFIQHDIAA